MPLPLTAADQERYEAFRSFATERLGPFAAEWDRAERVDPSAIAAMAQAGYLAATLAPEHNGSGMSAVVAGLLHEAVGRVCSSVRSLLTVHDMVARSVARWGTAEQRDAWLKRLATGETLGAFALSEPGGGSDAGAVATTAVPRGGGWVLTGRKRWITFGQAARLFLVFARTPEGVTAFLVERDRPGLAVGPIRGMLGTRASLLADVSLDGCLVPAEAVLGRLGSAHPHITQSALMWGRYSVAWGSAGIVRGCLEESSAHVRTRVPLADHQLVQRLIARMVANGEAARLLCLEAGRLLDARDPRSPVSAALAKYFATTAASESSREAVQLAGATGCSPDSPVERYFRDAKIMEVIEGSTEVQETLLGRHGAALFGAVGHARGGGS
jgi:alkylation response protein AidB-like acyl-CoA dehydrogenase